MENNAVLKAFDIVAATRRKKGLRNVFNPLAASKLPELKKALTDALETPAALDNLQLREALLTAAHAIEKHDTLPEKKTVNTYADPIPFDFFSPPRVTGKKTINNPARRKTLLEMQQNLYKKLKPHLKA